MRYTVRVLLQEASNRPIRQRRLLTGVEAASYEDAFHMGETESARQDVHPDHIVGWQVTQDVQ